MQMSRIMSHKIAKIIFFTSHTAWSFKLFENRCSLSTDQGKSAANLTGHYIGLSLVNHKHFKIWLHTCIDKKYVGVIMSCVFNHVVLWLLAITTYKSVCRSMWRPFSLSKSIPICTAIIWACFLHAEEGMKCQNTST